MLTSIVSAPGRCDSRRYLPPALEPGVLKGDQVPRGEHFGVGDDDYVGGVASALFP